MSVKHFLLGKFETYFIWWGTGIVKELAILIQTWEPLNFFPELWNSIKLHLFDYLWTSLLIVFLIDSPKSRWIAFYPPKKPFISTDLYLLVIWRKQLEIPNCSDQSYTVATLLLQRGGCYWWLLLYLIPWIL